MEKYSKIALFISGVLLILVGVPRLVLGTWVAYSNYAFYGALALFFLSIALNYKTVFDFLKMKTTKHGLNMGTMIFLSLFLMFCVNFIALRNDISVDITKEKLNSLSLQSTEVLDNLKKDVDIKVFYQGEMHANDNIGLKMLFTKYKRESSKIKTQFIDAHKDPSSSKYLSREDKGKLVIVMKMGERTDRVKEPFTEESITSALFRITKTDSKKIYFLTGHGERNFQAPSQNGAEGISQLTASLKEKGFSISPLNLITTKEVPEDAAMVAVLGPQQNLLKEEIEELIHYMYHGGRLLLAADPKSNHNLNELSEKFGIQLVPNYLLTVREMSPLTVYGQSFDPQSQITRKFKQDTITVFDEASELKAVDTQGEIQVHDLVKTAPITISVSDLQKYQKESKGQKPRSVTIAMTAEGLFSEDDHHGHDHGHSHGDEETEEKFAAAVFSDSDFLSDLRFSGYNRDLALNTFAFLSGETNLISIRPRMPKDTKLVMTSSYATFSIIFSILGPLILITTSLLLWIRRRGA